MEIICKAKWTSGGWLTDKTKSGLLPFDLHIHDLDFLVSILGLPEKRYCTSSWSGKDGMPQQYRFLYEFEYNGQKINICVRKLRGSMEIIRGQQAIVYALSMEFWNPERERQFFIRREKSRKYWIHQRNEKFQPESIFLQPEFILKNWSIL